MKLAIAVTILSFVAANDHHLRRDTVRDEHRDPEPRHVPTPMNELIEEQVEAYQHLQEKADAEGLTVVSPKIVNGVEVNPPGKYPYMTYAYGCGASLIAPNVLLCAAHCKGFIDQVQIGRHNLNNNNESFETFTIAEEVAHPNYNANTMDYDFMVMRLNGSSTYTPVQLDNGEVPLSADRDVIVMGWGATSSGGSVSSKLMEVEVDLKSQSSCNSSYGGGITNRMVCAARSTGSVHKDSCQGDSGGPLIDKATGKQIGIVSWGYGCANPNYPGVYAKVQDQINWINGYIDQWSGDNPAPSPVSPPSGGSCQDFPNFVDSYGDGCSWYENNSNPGCGEWAGCCDAGMGSPDEACCFCGGGTTVGPPVPSPTISSCSSITNRSTCNNTSGCGFNVFQNKCLDALTTSECSLYNGRRVKCNKNGCLWKNFNKKCVGRWD